MRTIKILLSLNMALLCLVSFGQNLANPDSAFGFFSYVLGNTGHEVYPASLVPAVTSPLLIWIAMVTVFIFELLSGLLVLNGTWHLWRARNAVPADFQAAKKTTYLGAGLGVLTWFGLFHVVGGTFFQMWQTPVGVGSLRGAFWYGGILVLSSLFIALLPDD